MLKRWPNHFYSQARTCGCHRGNDIILAAQGLFGVHGTLTSSANPWGNDLSGGNLPSHDSLFDWRIRISIMSYTSASTPSHRHTVKHVYYACASHCFRKSLEMARAYAKTGWDLWPQDNIPLDAISEEDEEAYQEWNGGETWNERWRSWNTLLESSIQVVPGHTELDIVCCCPKQHLNTTRDDDALQQSKVLCFTYDRKQFRS